MKYIMTKESYIYEVVNTYHDSKEGYTRYELELVCGIDYIPYSNEQGFVPAERFMSTVHYDHVTHFPAYDGKLESYLNSQNMEIIEVLPVIHG